MIVNLGLSTIIPFFLAIKFLSLLIMAEALVVSKNFLYFLFARNVIVPSLPGFGFSGRPSRPIGPRKMSSIFNSLMTDVLGYLSLIHI